MCTFYDVPAFRALRPLYVDRQGRRLMTRQRFVSPFAPAAVPVLQRYVMECWPERCHKLWDLVCGLPPEGQTLTELNEDWIGDLDTRLAALPFLSILPTSGPEPFQHDARIEALREGARIQHVALLNISSRQDLQSYLAGLPRGFHQFRARSLLFTYEGADADVMQLIREGWLSRPLLEETSLGPFDLLTVLPPRPFFSLPKISLETHWLSPEAQFYVRPGEVVRDGEQWKLPGQPSTSVVPLTSCLPSATLDAVYRLSSPPEQGGRLQRAGALTALTAKFRAWNPGKKRRRI